MGTLYRHTPGHARLRWLLALIAMALTLAALLAACAPTPASSPTATPTARSGPSAPPFSLPSASGGQVSLSDYLGESWVVLVFYRGFG